MQSIKLLGFITAILFLTVVIAGCDANAPAGPANFVPHSCCDARRDPTALKQSLASSNPITDAGTHLSTPPAPSPTPTPAPNTAPHARR